MDKLFFSFFFIFCLSGCKCPCYHVAATAYQDSVYAALHCTRSNETYDGCGYSDSRAAGEDSHYHDDPGQYDGKGSEDRPKGYGADIQFV